MNRTAETAGAGVKWLGLIGGPLIALLCYHGLPTAFTDATGAEITFTPAGRATLAVMAWMATWWLTEAIDLSATALLPLAVFPLFGIAPLKETATPYGSDIIFLFLGGFLIALALQRWGLDRRIALLTLRLVGTRPSAMIGGFMAITALLSMWVSNTATAAMMMPIALGVIDLVLRQGAATPPAGRAGFPPADAPGRHFALSLMLGIAYAAAIGGMATIIGSPPNGILVQFVEREYGQVISFVDWFKIGGVFTLVFLPLAWALITWVLYPFQLDRIEGGGALIEQALRELGPMKPGEWLTLGVFLMTALLWISRPLLVSVEIAGVTPLAGLTDAGIAIGAGLWLFVLPVDIRHRTFTLDWATAQQLPWGILILFGGGLSLAGAVDANGVATFIGAQAVLFAGAPPWLLVLAVTTLVIFLTELTSNTATTATLVPVLAALAPGLGIAPALLIFPATLAASCAFMMPVATPPNAIVFGTGYVTLRQMMSVGWWLNLTGIVLITVLTMTILRRVLNV